MNGGILTNAIQNPWNAPIAVPIRTIVRIASQTGTLRFTIRMAPTAPTKQTTDPTERSMLPPVKIHKSIPVARMNTYAFCEIRLLTFIGSRIAPPVCQAKNATTITRTITIVFFFKNPKICSLRIFLLLVSG